MLPECLTRHPHAVGESYGEHLVVASRFGIRMILGGLACMAHGLLPFLFERTGSGQVAVLHDRMVANRRRPIAIDPMLELGRGI